LLVTLAIAAILLTVAVPNFVIFIQNNRLMNQANDFVTALSYARSEAVKRGVEITVCSRSTNTQCAGTTNWDSGFLVFVDANRDGDASLGEEILQVRGDMQGSNTLRAGASTRISYQSSGFRADPFGNEIFNLCDTRGAVNGRAITVSPQGRASVATGAGACP